MTTHNLLGIILHSIEGVKYKGDALSEYDARELQDAEVVEAWYSYEAGYYEGNGDLIARTVNGKWIHKNLGHCSCYGPCDGIVSNDKHNSLNELEEYLYPHARESAQPLINVIRATSPT